MQKKREKKEKKGLTVKKERLRQLTSTDLENVAGGGCPQCPTGP